MAYRNIEVNGKAYKWTVGEKNVKIVAEDRSFSKVYSKEAVAEFDSGCECCGEGSGFVVRPGIIRSLILAA